MFVNLVHFPATREGKDAVFVDWFQQSNEVYRGFPGFLSRRLLRADDGSYAAVVEHDNRSTFMAMHTSPERAALWAEVEPLLQGRPEPAFYDLVTKSQADAADVEGAES